MRSMRINGYYSSRRQLISQRISKDLSRLKGMPFKNTKTNSAN
jgi:hypothetical protein